MREILPGRLWLGNAADIGNVEGILASCLPLYLCGDRAEETSLKDEFNLNCPIPLSDHATCNWRTAAAAD